MTLRDFNKVLKKYTDFYVNPNLIDINIFSSDENVYNLFVKSPFKTGCRASCPDEFVHSTYFERGVARRDEMD